MQPITLKCSSYSKKYIFRPFDIWQHSYDTKWCFAIYFFFPCQYLMLWSFIYTDIKKKTSVDSCILPFIAILALQFYDSVVLLQNGSTAAYGPSLSTEEKKACIVIFIPRVPRWCPACMQMPVCDVSSCKINKWAAVVGAAWLNQQH